MLKDFADMVFSYKISVKDAAIILLIVIVLFVSRELLRKDTIKSLKRNQHIPAGEVRKGCIFLDPDDLIYKDQTSTDPLGSIGDWITSNLQEVQIGEIYVPFYSISVNGRFEILGAYGNVWVEPSNLKEKYPIHISKEEEQ